MNIYEIKRCLSKYLLILCDSMIARKRRWPDSIATVGLIIVATGCARSNPSAPSASASAATATAATASIGAPRPLTPANGAQIRNTDQPITLIAQNGIVTAGSAGTVYTFEVSTDPAFGTRAQTKDGVAEGAGGQAGQTSVKLDPLAAAQDYYWHVRATGGGTTGVFGATFKFTVGPAIVINAPVLVAPSDGAATSDQPTLTVANATRTGPAGPVFYRFDISGSASFSSVTVSTTVAEGSGGQTSFVPPPGLAINAVQYWRVTAIDPANAISSAPSAPRSFNTVLAIDIKKVVILHSADVSNWPVTANLSIVEQDGAPPGLMCMTFTDPGWPDSPWPFSNADPNFGVYANQWYFANIGGVWYGGAGEWMYRGAASCKAGQGTNTIGPDSSFGPPFSSWSPKPGELVGYMVSTVARDGPVQPTVNQRSNIIVQPWHDSGLQGFGLRRTLRK
jgi:hypothetical protein